MHEESELDRLRSALADRYDVEAPIGGGATATVYAATDRKHGRRVAIKLLRPDLSASVTSARFLREIGISARLQHPHIVPVLDSGMVASSIYFVMPFIEGESLRARLSRDGRMGPAETVRVLTDVVDALGYAHRQGVVHRDIKPDNIMLVGRHALVLDFGVAKALDEASREAEGLTVGVAIGTPAYMAPEQALAAPEMDHRVDIYAIGVVAYEMLAGRPPFQGRSAQDTLQAQVAQAPEPLESLRPDLLPALVAVVNRCLAKRPAERWATADELGMELDRFVGTPTGSWPAAAPAEPTRMSPAIRFAVGLAMLALGLAVVMAVTRQRTDGGNAVTTSRPRRFSFLGTVREVAISPDGSFLSYITATPEGQALWVEDSAGGAPVRVATSERIVGVSWIKGGAELSFTEGPVDSPVTRVVPRLGGSSTVVGRGRGLVSPNGALVLIATSGDPDLTVLRRATGDTIHLHRPREGWLNGVAWSPASDALLLALVNGDKSRTTFLVLGLDDRGQIVHEERGNAYGPAWAFGGSSAYFLVDAQGGKDIVRLELAHDFGSSNRTLVAAGLPLTDDSQRYPTGTFLSLSRDQGQLVFVEEEKWSNLATFSVSADRQAMQPAPYTMGTALFTSPRLSPDRQQIAVFVSSANGTSIATVPLGTNVLEPVAEVSLRGVPAWSPDGRMLAWSAGSADSGLRLWVRNIAEGTQRRLDGPVGREITWSTAGLFALRPGNHGLVRADLAAGHVGTPLNGDSVTGTFSPRASPDGRWIALLGYRGASAPATLLLASTVDSSYTELLASAYRPIGWSADSKQLFAVRSTFAPHPEELVSIDIATGRRRVIAMLPPGYEAEDVMPDGRMVVATQVQTKSDGARLALPPVR